MKKSFLIVAIIASILNAKDLSVNYDTKMVQPFVGLDYNMYSLDKIGFKNKAPGISVGFLLNNDSKFRLSFFRDTVDKTDTRYKVEEIDLKYGYSFNNFGLRKGFIMDAGVSSMKINTITQEEVSTQDSNGDITKSIENIDNQAKSWYFTLSVGYEHKIGKNYILDIKHSRNLKKFSNDTHMVTFEATTLSFKYLFDY